MCAAAPVFLIFTLNGNHYSMKVSFYLTRSQTNLKSADKKETSIYARICYSGLKVKYFTPESIHPDFWNNKTQRAKETQKFREYPEFNARINKFESDIKSIYRKFVNDEGLIPSPDTLKKLIDITIKKIEVAKRREITFMGMLDDIRRQCEEGIRLSVKNSKPISRNTYKAFKTVYNHLSNYQNTTGKKVDFDIIDLNFYDSYIKYLIKTVKLSTNTIGKHVQVIKYVLNEATEKGINTKLDFKNKRFKSLREKTDSIYLTELEINALLNLDLSASKSLDHVRDLFIISCRTGLRHSDSSILRPDHISEGFINIKQTKTLDEVSIPIHQQVKKILEKYNGQLPRALSNQKTNDHLKEIGKKLDLLKAKVSKSTTKGGATIVKTYHKWELLTTHVGRRTFATLEYLAGTPAITIMAITGHKTERNFLAYIKLSSSDHAKILKQHWQNRNDLKAV